MPSGNKKNKNPISPPPIPFPKRKLLPLRWNWSRRHILNLLNQEFALVDELLVIGTILKEVRQEGEKLLTVHEEDLLHGDRLVGVGHEDFEDVEALILDHFPIVAQ
jgi:hypothetical protein